MNRLFIIMALLIGFSAGTAVWAQSNNESGGNSVETPTPTPLPNAPRIEFEGRTYDFGTVYSGQKLVHDFEYKNAGAAILSVTKVRTSCGCTGAVISTAGVLPGATGIISVSMTVSMGTGPIRQTATISTNDPQKPEVTLEMIATARNLWSFSPQTSFNFREVPILSNQSMTLYLKNSEPGSFKVFATKVDKPEFTVQTGELTAEGLPITVTVKPGSQKGFLSSRLEIRTDHPKQPFADTTVFANIVGLVRFSQERIFFGVLRAGETTKKTITATYSSPTSGKSLQINGVSSESPEVKCTMVGNNPDGAVQLEFTYTAPTTPGYKTGFIDIKTNVDGEPTARLPFNALIQRS